MNDDQIYRICIIWRLFRLVAGMKPMIVSCSTFYISRKSFVMEEGKRQKLSKTIKAELVLNVAHSHWILNYKEIQFFRNFLSPMKFSVALEIFYGTFWPIYALHFTSFKHLLLSIVIACHSILTLSLVQTLRRLSRSNHRKISTEQSFKKNLELDSQNKNLSI